MPTPKALEPSQAKTSLANRFVRLGDRLRQLNTKFGIRAKRVFLVWTKSSGTEVGEGDERIIARVEVLPTPKIADLSSVALNPFSAGKLPVGVIRVSEVTQTLTFDQLTGRRVPGRTEPIEEPFDFYYVVQEDGRGDNQADAQRYRLFSTPNRAEGKVEWQLLLERQSREPDRNGKPSLPDEL